jgi:hypothetical protein
MISGMLPSFFMIDPSACAISIYTSPELAKQSLEFGHFKERIINKGEQKWVFLGLLLKVEE